MSDLAGLPVADPWFILESAGDGITLVTEPHVHPLLRCNVWHVRGRTVDLVVDTSLGLRPLRHLVEHDLAHELLAVATHVHGDHVGGMHEFDQRAIHAAEADELAAPARSRSTPPSSGLGSSAPTEPPATKWARCSSTTSRLAVWQRPPWSGHLRRRRESSARATSSISATAVSRFSTFPATPPGASGCGR